jgi:hypothetical protein
MFKKTKFAFVLALALGVASCTPKVGVLRSPSHQGTGNVTSNTTETNEPENKTEDTSSKLGKSKKIINQTISLVLPFQLDQIDPKLMNDKDIKRSALALDFYQGFQLGIDELSQKGNDFNINVLDSRDNASFAASLALGDDVNTSSIIVGPIYPVEIKSFGAAFQNKNVIQINPLAASMPTEFNIPNLVSITPPIKAHTVALGTKAAKDNITGDKIIIYNTADSDSKQFLNGMMTAIKQIKPNVSIVSVSTLAQLNENLISTGTNQIIAGTTDKTQLNNLISNLSRKFSESSVSIKLYGHPLWDRFDFSTFSSFAYLNPTITSESHLKTWTQNAKVFKDNYNKKFRVNPSDHSYKGYDAAIYFGSLLKKYGPEKMHDAIMKEPFTGIYSAYKFKHGDAWGYANETVSYKIFRSGSFQLQ